MNNITLNRRLNIKSLLLLCVFVFLISEKYSIAQGSNSAQSPDYKTRRFLLRDEGLSQLSYTDIANPKANWYTPVPTGRDMQLVGNGRVLIGTGNGYEERDIVTGNKVTELTSFPGTLTAHRLKNGNTLLTGENWQGKQGMVLVEVDKGGTVKRLTAYPGFSYGRLVRQTTSGTFLVTADDKVFEGNDKGEIIWQVMINATSKPHVWQALRLANGQTIISTGYAKNLMLFGKDEKLIDSISGPAEVNPHFYAGFQILPNGNYVVTNWQGHGPKFGASGVQLLEYSPKGVLVWSWKQGPEKYSSLQGVIVLDGLDLKRMHVEDGNGRLAPVK
ncbi:MAG: hypothetical protein ABIN89_29515 [Chitinophagaceae bacterium]